MQIVLKLASKLKEKSLSDLIRGRLAWYKLRFQMDNRAVGRLVEIFGNHVRIDGVTLNLDNPQIPTEHKSSIFFGLYEVPERKFAREFIDRDLPTIEFGGCIGGVSCVVNKLLREPKNHVVVECGPEMLPTLRKNRDLNDAAFTIEPCALAYGTDTVSFGVADWMKGSMLQTDKPQVTVAATTLGKLLNKYNFDVINLISDCEGAETGLTDNEIDVMKRRVKWFIAELHPGFVGENKYNKMLDDLSAAGFVARAKSRGAVFAFENTALNWPRY